MAKDGSKCAYPHCRNREGHFPGITYYGVFICDTHWNKLAEQPGVEIRNILGIKELDGDSRKPGTQG